MKNFKKIVAVSLITAVLSSIGFAAANPEKALTSSSVSTEEDWKKLVTRAVLEGTVTDYEEYGTYATLTELTPNDKNADHLANYFSAVGGIDGNNNFIVFRVESVWENWVTDENGNWNVDQWLLRFSPNGELIRGVRFQLIETKNRTVLKHQEIPTTDEEFHAKWNEILTGWLAKK